MAQSKDNNSEMAGLAYWVDRVLKEHSKLEGGWAPDTVHDLRIALRRCIVIADLMRHLDPGSDWNLMRKAGKRFFRQVGLLRDTQILLDWVEKLGPAGDASTVALLEELNGRSQKDLAAAQEAAREFDRKQWRAWSRGLARNFRHLASDRPACEAIALEAWEDVRELHRQAQKSYSQLACHRLRTGLKRFRYTVENILPSLHVEWVGDLKLLQDLLGEIHDLDVLSQMISGNRLLFDEVARAAWTEKLRTERASRLDRYRQKMAGKSSPLWTWREGLPSGRELRAVGLARLAQWSYFASPEFPRVRKIAKFALQLYDGFTNAGLMETGPEIETRLILHAAALLQDVGYVNRRKAYHKESYRLIRKAPPPVGWTETDMELVALLARFHRRALPHLNHKLFQKYQLPLSQSLIQLAAFLRMANAFAAKPYRAVRRLELENCAGVIVVRAQGYNENDSLKPKLMEAKRLLEVSSHRLVHVLSPTARVLAPQLVKQPTQRDAA